MGNQELCHCQIFNEIQKEEDMSSKNNQNNNSDSPDKNQHFLKNELTQLHSDDYKKSIKSKNPFKKPFPLNANSSTGPKKLRPLTKNDSLFEKTNSTDHQKEKSIPITKNEDDETSIEDKPISEFFLDDKQNLDTLQHPIHNEDKMFIHSGGNNQNNNNIVSDNNKNYNINNMSISEINSSNILNNTNNNNINAPSNNTLRNTKNSENNNNKSNKVSNIFTEESNKIKNEYKNTVQNTKKSEKKVKFENKKERKESSPIVDSDSKVLTLGSYKDTKQSGNHTTRSKQNSKGKHKHHHHHRHKSHQNKEEEENDKDKGSPEKTLNDLSFRDNSSIIRNKEEEEKKSIRKISENDNKKNTENSNDFDYKESDILRVGQFTNDQRSKYTESEEQDEDINKDDKNSLFDDYDDDDKNEED